MLAHLSFLIMFYIIGMWAHAATYNWRGLPYTKAPGTAKQGFINLVLTLMWPLLIAHRLWVSFKN